MEDGICGWSCLRMHEQTARGSDGEKVESRWQVIYLHLPRYLLRGLKGSGLVGGDTEGAFGWLEKLKGSGLGPWGEACKAP